jgi:hypothetical protein
VELLKYRHDRTRHADDFFIQVVNDCAQAALPRENGGMPKYQILNLYWDSESNKEFEFSILIAR